MLEAILANKAFKLSKKYWQVLAGVFATLALYVFKRNYDNNIKEEVVKKIETNIKISTAKKQNELSDAGEAALIKQANDPTPNTWDGLKQLSKDAKPNRDAAIAADRIRKKLQRKK